MRALELKIPPVVIGLFLGAAMGATARLVPDAGFTLPTGRTIAAGLALAGVLTAVMGVVSFRRAKTTVNPLQPGQATALVIAGIYWRTRNPMYLGMLLVLLGWAVFLGNVLAFPLAGAFIPLMNRLQIGPEEKILVARFGSEYTTYLSNVRRWF